MVFITAASTALGILANVSRPDRLPWVINPSESINPSINKALGEIVSISSEDLIRYHEAGKATFVDARREEEYAEGHLSGAVNIPSINKEMYLDRVFAQLPPNGLIIIYCEGNDCASSSDVFEFLVLNGFNINNLRIYQPGWEKLGEMEEIPVEYGSSGYEQF